MASTVPAKSQSLHNFALPRLSWNNNHPRGGGGGGSGVGGGRGGGGDGGGGGGEGVEHKRHVRKVSESHDRKVEKSEKSRVVGSDHEVNVTSRDKKGNDKEPRSRILIKIPASMRNLVSDKVKEEEEVEVKEENQVMVDEQKPWNLRPRRAVKRSSNGDVGGGGAGGLKGGGGGCAVEKKKKDQLQERDIENGSRIRAEKEKEKEKEKKVKFSLCLTRQEIEEDVYSFTGLKPSRRPKKRTKVVQKYLDNVFPGQWLGSITHDSYKVSESSMKG